MFNLSNLLKKASYVLVVCGVIVPLVVVTKKAIVGYIFFWIAETLAFSVLMFTNSARERIFIQKAREGEDMELQLSECDSCKEKIQKDFNRFLRFNEFVLKLVIVYIVIYTIGSALSHLVNSIF